MDSGEFSWSLSTTKTIIKFMGFKFVRSHAVNHAILIENEFIRNKRKMYIEKIRQYRAEGRNIYYFDESYVNSNHCPERVLTDTSIKSAKDAEDRGLTTGVYETNNSISALKIEVDHEDTLDLSLSRLDFDFALKI